jgi:hypothetical protein
VKGFLQLRLRVSFFLLEGFDPVGASFEGCFTSLFGSFCVTFHGEGRLIGLGVKGYLFHAFYFFRQDRTDPFRAAGLSDDARNTQNIRVLVCNFLFCTRVLRNEYRRAQHESNDGD